MSSHPFSRDLSKPAMSVFHPFQTFRPVGYLLIADIWEIPHSLRMSWHRHQALVRKGVALASILLLLTVVMQLPLQADFRGLPFLFFGLIVGSLGLSLFVRAIWEKLFVPPQG